MEESATNSASLSGEQESQDSHRGETEEGLLRELIEKGKDVGEEDDREHPTKPGSAREGFVLVLGDAGTGRRSAEGIKLQSRSDLPVGVQAAVDREWNDLVASTTEGIWTSSQGIEKSERPYEESGGSGRAHLDGGHEEGDQRGGEGCGTQPCAAIRLRHDVDVEGSGIGSSQGGHLGRREGKDSGFDFEGGKEGPGVLGVEEDITMLLQWRVRLVRTMPV